MVTTVGYVWYTSIETVGIALTYDTIERKMKGRILPVSGLDEQMDLKTVLEWGARFPVIEAMSLIKKHGTLLIPREELEDIIKEI